MVCDDDQVAADAIRYLKEERLGRVTFLPLNKLKPPSLPPLKEQGVIDYAVNLLEYDPKYDRAFAVALGSTVVVDTLERARRLIGKYRMVTLEGELLEKSGAMTGGATKKQGGEDSVPPLMMSSSASVHILGNCRVKRQRLKPG